MTSNTWLENTLLPAILCVMIGCIVLSAVSVIQMIVPDWDGTYLVVFCVLTAAEAFLAFHLFRRDLIYLLDSARLFLMEMAALFLCLQLYVDLMDGQAPLESYIPHFDGKTLGLFAIVFLAWFVATECAQDLNRLGRPSEGTLGYVPAERRLASRFFAGGIILFIVAGLSQSRIADAVKFPNSGASGPVFNVLLYFLLGILVLGSVHYEALRARWQRGDIAIAQGLGNRWVRYSLGFVGMTAVVAFLLPTTHTIGLLDLGRAIWDPISGVLTQIILAIRGPLTWLLRLIGGNAPVRREQLPKQLPPHLPLPRRHHSGHGANFGGGLILLKSLLFWGVILAAAVYLLRVYLPRTRLRMPLIGGVVGMVRGAIARLWTTLLSRLRGYAEAAAERLPHSVTVRGRPSMPGRGRFGFTRVGSLPPREQVLYYYLSVVRRAGREGLPRLGSQTPREFATSLAPHLSEAAPDMEHLTDAFVEARYSRHEVPLSQVDRIRASWQRIRSALRRGVKRST